MKRFSPTASSELTITGVTSVMAAESPPSPPPPEQAAAMTADAARKARAARALPVKRSVLTDAPLTVHTAAGFQLLMQGSGLQLDSSVLNTETSCEQQP